MSTAAGNFFTIFVRYHYSNLIRFPLFKDGVLVSGITFSGAMIQVGTDWYAFTDWGNVQTTYPAEVGTSGVYECWADMDTTDGVCCTIIIPATANYDTHVIQCINYGEAGAQIDSFYGDSTPITIKRMQEFKIERGK